MSSSSYPYVSLLNEKKQPGIVSNGRVDIMQPNTSDLFTMYDKIPAHQCATFRNPTEGIWNDTGLSDAYFSQQNIQRIQNGIQQGVFQKSNGQYKIGPQDCDTLKVIMRSIFLQYSSNLPNNIQQQVNELNQMVLNYCVPQVYSEAQGYLQYLVDASTMYTPLAPPVLSRQEEKIMEMKPWF